MDPTNLAQAVVNGVLIGGLYCLVAVGLTLVFGVMRLINLAHGEFVMIGSYVAYWLLAIHGMAIGWAAIAAVIVVAGIALVVKKTLIERIIGTPHLNQILLTYGLALCFQNLALLLFSPNYVSVTLPVSTLTIALGGVSVGVLRAVVFVLAVVLIGTLFLFLRFSGTGKAIRAVAQDREAAMYMGIDVERMYLVTFTIGAGMAAVAGVMTSLIMYVYPYVGFAFVVKAFAVVILGGLGSIGGAIVAGLLLGMTESVVGTYLPGGPGWAEGLAFVVLIVTLMIRPSGLFGTKMAVA